MIKSQREMLDSILAIKPTCTVLSDGSNKENSVDPIEKSYEQLKADLHPLYKQCAEWEMIHRYVENSNAHQLYNMDILEIYRVSRQGERRRFRPYQQLHNRMLLWHGSRIVNFAGILSAGLKIAPPEAQQTGKMFGNGIYFTDMISKAANFCLPTPQNTTGLVLLCEVALGNVQEMVTGQFITAETLPPNVHSVKGVGKVVPDPKGFHLGDDGVLVPYGKPVRCHTQSLLNYNEYVIYDPAQVNIRYLVKLKFNYNVG